MLIFVPMAGFGDRYIRAGYKDPKPLIPVDGVTMIKRVLEAFAPAQPGDKYLFTVNRQHSETTPIVSELKKLVPNATIIVCETHKDGPIQTLLSSREHIPLDEEVILNYCDFGVDWSYPDFRAWLAKNKWASAMSGYRGFHPHSLGPTLYAYMRVAPDGETVDEIREKHFFTDNKFNEFASSGLYYFASGKLLLDVAEKMIASGERVQGEFYVSMAIQEVIKGGGKTGVYPLKHFYQWGTPDDLRDWEAWSRSMRRLQPFADIVKNAKMKSAHVIPMAGRGQRFVDQGYKDPKPLIDIAGKPMIAQVLATLPTPSKRVLIAQKEHASDARFKQTIASVAGESKVIELNEITEGQACTAEIGLRDVADETPVLFASCDTGHMYDVDTLLKLEGDGDCDLAIFSAQNHLPALWRPQMYGWIFAGPDGLVKNVAVKKQIDGIEPRAQSVVTGTFWFRSKKVFMDEYNAMIKANDRVNNEFYIDTMARRMVERGAKVRAFPLEKYIPWGTPEEVKTFNYWNEVFRGGAALK